MKLTEEQRAAVAAAIAELDTMEVGDPEGAHAAADEALLTLLRALGLGEVADAYDRLVERAPWWACA